MTSPEQAPGAGAAHALCAEAAPAVEPPYAAVVNDEGQYSLWPVWRPLPAGWRDTGVHGEREECLAHIERVWTDMRPLSVVRATGTGGGPAA
ncbi:MbtH family NRPS accessory protein [Streptomyces sp. ICBB 8177]|uniref:MbtH family protein n=1 Tax=Streptomyces sp. ICBB 8177 TaxID=563922 RepID=UPI000D675806|nr:MbtH family NRPS accessory protein [Streptomyces sp. ICBB 8177]PWI42763.1 antibiotic synthesis protein MbtH [Streptomyces sp. ICBB 8177]